MYLYDSQNENIRVNLEGFGLQAVSDGTCNSNRTLIHPFVRSPNRPTFFEGCRLTGGQEVVVLGGQGIGSAPRNADAIEVEKGLSVRTASLDDLIRMKEAADRMKDQRSP
jgi:hypothetical protein